MRRGKLADYTPHTGMRKLFSKRVERDLIYFPTYEAEDGTSIDEPKEVTLAQPMTLSLMDCIVSSSKFKKKTRYTQFQF